MTQPPLPLELYRLIIEHVNDTAALISLALCSSAFRDEAQRCLFRLVDAKSLHRHTPFPTAINASPLRLGPLVHALDFAPLMGFNLMDRTWTVPLSLALRALQNLKHLAIDMVNPSTVLQDCTFELQTLYFGGLYKLPSSEVLFLLCNFLPTQHSMKKLRIIYNLPFNVMEVPSSLCPNLDYLGVSDFRFLVALLHDTRLITRMEWYSLGTPQKMTIKQLNRLEYLSFSIDIDLPDIDTSFILNLTSLVHLELYITLSTPNFLSEKLQFLRNIPLLGVLVFIINGMYLDDPRFRGPERWREYHIHPTFTSAYQHAFKLCPTLKYIDAGRMSKQFYNRFFRPKDGEISDLVSDRLVDAREVQEWKRFV